LLNHPPSQKLGFSLNNMLDFFLEVFRIEHTKPNQGAAKGDKNMMTKPKSKSKSAEAKRADLDSAAAMVARKRVKAEKAAKAANAAGKIGGEE